MGVLLLNGLYWPFAVSLYPFLGCLFSKGHIHSYFLHIMYELLPPPLVLVNWLSYFFPSRLFLRQSTPFHKFSILDIVLVFLRSLVSSSLASAIFSFLSTDSYWSFVSICYYYTQSSCSVYSLLSAAESYLIVILSWSFISWFVLIFSLISICLSSE